MNRDLLNYIKSYSAIKKIDEKKLLNILDMIIIKLWRTVYNNNVFDLEWHEDENDKTRNLYQILTVTDLVTNKDKEMLGKNIGEKIKIKVPLDFKENHIKILLSDLEYACKREQREEEFLLYSGKIGQVLPCTFIRREGHHIIVQTPDNNFGILYSDKQLANYQRMVKDQKIWCRVENVKRDNEGYQIILDRKSDNFLLEMLKKHIPEIENGTIFVKNIARIPGELSKIAIDSEIIGPETNIVLSCLGHRSQRRNDLMNELSGEKIDFIRWSDDIYVLIENAFSYLKERGVRDNLFIYKDFDPSISLLTLVIPDVKFLQALGVHGKNIQLISRLLRVKIKLIRETEHMENCSQKIKQKSMDLIDLGIEESTADYIAKTYEFDLSFALQDITLDSSVKDKLEIYLEREMLAKLDDYIKAGGDKDFFMDIEGIPSQVYFHLINFQVFSARDLSKYENAQQMSFATNIDEDYCVLLLEYFHDRNLL